MLGEGAVRGLVYLEIAIDRLGRTGRLLRFPTTEA
jgi:hypothetical protein